MAYNKILFFLLLIFTLQACQKVEIMERDLSHWAVPEQLPVNSILVHNDSLYIGLGDLFNRGGLWVSPIDSPSWDSLLVLNHAVRDLQWLDDRLYAYPIGNTVYYREGGIWSGLYMPGWEYFSAGHFFSDSAGILVAGENLGLGRIHRLRANGNFPNLLQADSFLHSFSDLAGQADGRALAVGYGLILKTTDYGQNWAPMPPQGNYFRAISWPDSLNAFVAGDYGSVYKSEDGGESWQKLLSGRTINPKYRWRCILALDQDHLAVGGQDGALLLSEDGGQNWQKLQGLEGEEILCLAHDGQFWYLGTAQGHIWRFMY